jgi:hypothetical protein
VKKEYIKVIAMYMNYEPIEILGRVRWVDRSKHPSKDLKVLEESMNFNRDGFLDFEELPYGKSIDSFLPVWEFLNIKHDVKLNRFQPETNECQLYYTKEWKNELPNNEYFTSKRDSLHFSCLEATALAINEFNDNK